MKKKTTTILIVIATLVLAALSIFIVLRIKSLGTRPVAPNAPESLPRAEEGASAPQLPTNPLNSACKKTFSVITPTPGPSITPSPTPSLGPSNTPTPGPTSTPAPGPTNTPTPGPTTIVQQPSPTEVQLPEAGIKIPALAGMILGFLLISFGVVFIF